MTINPSNLYLFPSNLTFSPLSPTPLPPLSYFPPVHYQQHLLPPLQIHGSCFSTGQLSYISQLLSTENSKHSTPSCTSASGNTNNGHFTDPSTSLLKHWKRMFELSCR